MNKNKPTNMSTKKILGLDLGTNSIGWAVVNQESNGCFTGISHAGSRIIPMDAAMLGDFESGNTISQTGARTQARGMRRMYERFHLRRERLNRVLGVLGFLPSHYASCLNRYGQLLKGEEPKLAWTNDKKFIFGSAFDEMVSDFQKAHPELFVDGKSIAYDWTIYYLRKKALTSPITGQELAWVLHQFNQKRGYNESRNEVEEARPTERKEFCTFMVTDVVDTGEVNKGRTWYNVLLDNGWVYRRQSSYPLDWKGKKKNFIVTTKLNEDGTEKVDKDGNIKRSLSAPSDDDWSLIKIKTEQDIARSGKTVGEFIYDALLENPDQKIIGQLVRTVDRRFYREEVLRILSKQIEFLPQLQDKKLYQQAIEALYQHNESYRNSIASRDFIYLIMDNVLFYQRPLKSKKSLINECPFEYHVFRNKQGEEQRKYLKCISKSHPVYEEFRVRQFVGNLHLYCSEDGLHSTDCTADYVKAEELVQWLLTQKEVDQKALVKQICGKRKDITWNYVIDKVYPMAPTRSLLLRAGVEKEVEVLHLWHILYSVSDKTELEQAILHYAQEHDLGEDFVTLLKKQKPFAADYGAYSEKATRKLLSLMRSGDAWSKEAIDKNTVERIEHILTGEFDKNIDLRVRERCSQMCAVTDFQGLPVWLAEYVVYGVRKNDVKWSSPDDIDTYLQQFRLHSLNNPVVEQVVTETLRTVRDIWKQEGHIDEIHIEMGRELKLPAAKRKQMQQRQMENEKANAEARIRIQEYVSNPSNRDVKKYRLWEEQKHISPYTGQPIELSELFTSAYEIEHVIPQSRYFDDSMTNKVISEAEVNHLKDRMLGHEFIMQHGGEKVTLTGGRVVSILSKDEYENLVKDTFNGNKSKQEKLMLDDIPDGFIARQLNDSRYISNLVRGLLSNVVREQNPETGEYEPEQTSKNMIVCNGSITTRLKKDWGMNDVWNHIILPRFERMNQLTESSAYTYVSNNGNLIPTVPQELQGGFEKKRIDHRHHAMDAIIIACTTRNHVALLSNENAMSERREQHYALSQLLRETAVAEWNGKKHTIFGNFVKPWATFTQNTEAILQNIIVSFKQNLRVVNRTNNRYTKIVDGIKVLARQQKGDMMAIRKPLHKETVFGEVNLRLKKTANLKYALSHINDIVDKDLRKKFRELATAGLGEKLIKAYFDENKDAWRDINLQKIEVFYFSKDTNDRYYATRTAINESFDKKFICEHITDEGIQQILLRHLESCGGDPALAFSVDGLYKMNENICALNGGVPHKPIYKVRKYEKAEKFAVGTNGVNAKKFVEAAKGTSLYTMVYEAEDGKDGKVRKLIPLTLQSVIMAIKESQKNWVESLDKMNHAMGRITPNYQYKFMLSPGMLVYLPTDEEERRQCYVFHRSRIYKVVSLDGENPNFLPCSIASMVVDGEEFTRHNKSSRSLEGLLIKKTCIPIYVDRLGNIIQ